MMSTNSLSPHVTCIRTASDYIQNTNQARDTDKAFAVSVSDHSGNHDNKIRGPINLS